MIESSEDALRRARKALRLAGLAPELELTRAPSNANEVWLGGDFALRVNASDDRERLRREASIAAHLPPGVLYPAVLGSGADDELEWIVVRRVAGSQLSRVWPQLHETQRERAGRDLALALRALHGTPGLNLPGDSELCPPHTLPLGPLLELLARLRRLGIDVGLLEAVEQLVRACWDAFDDTQRGLVHGDLHLENVLFHEQGLSAVLDLEWSRRSWLEVDLETVLAFCDHPRLFVSADYEDQALASDYAKLPQWLVEHYPELVAHPRCADRVALLHASRTLSLLEADPRTGRFDPCDPSDRRNHLRRLLDSPSFLFAGIRR